MKKTILDFGKAISKAGQKQINGGGNLKDPCPCTSQYNNHGDGFCSYPALFPAGFYCFGEIQGGQCCES